MGFLDKILKKDDGNKAKSSGGGIPNLFGNKQPQTFHGQGQSLGGSMPGTVIPISLPNPGPLGVRVEKRPNSEGTAIVNEVVPGSQAEAAGMKRGDILCFAGSNGQEEMMYDMFLELAKSPERPLLLEVRRITTKWEKPVDSASNNDNQKKNKSAEVDHRRQAVIAAAEARERAHKAKSKPIKQVTKTTLAREKKLQQEASSNSSDNNHSVEGPRSEEAKRAAEAAKLGEAQLAQQLGYNPYETARATAGQARTATTTAQHGTISAPGSGGPADDYSFPSVAPPRNAMEPAREGNDGDDDYEIELPSEFDEALATMVSANSVTDTVQSTCSIMKKLLVNATTKGQDLSNEESAAKFRKVRLANPKIKAALVDVDGAMDIMLLAGFVLDEQEGESVLMFPAAYPGPEWLSTALKRLDAVASGN